MTEEQLLRLWGKTDRKSKETPPPYHPLLFHMLDVAHVARLMWDRCLSPAARRDIKVALDIPDDTLAGLAVSLLAGLHDLGKACPAFQQQVPSLFTRLGLPATDQNSLHPVHGFVSAKELMKRLSAGEVWWTAEKEAAYCLAAITGGHHGVFPSSAALNKTLYEAEPGREKAWQAARERLIARFVSLVAGESTPAIVTSSLKQARVVPLLAGLISVADWIGSSPEHFPPKTRADSPIPSPEEYVKTLLKKAQKALEDSGWLPEAKAAPPSGMREVFGYIDGFEPGVMQAKVAEFAERAEGPYLLLVEAGMGMGKTEAALYAFDCAFAKGRTHGLYVALPTMATGTAMFRRMQRYFTERGHGGRLNLQLVHGNALLNEEFHELVFGPVYQESEDPQGADKKQGAGERGAVSAAAWFTARKRPLLAPFGAGTIDQGLLGILQTRHWFVRLFGLAGKVIIFDEVHAYDTYMVTELKRLLAWLRELNCTVVLLSATLPSQARDELLDAWQPGASAKLSGVKYPRVTLVNTEGVQEVHVGEASPLDRTVEIKVAPPEPETMSALVRRNLPNGGCGVILCNTVDRAQSVFRVLQKEFEPKGWRCRLFHARMPLAWREEREKQILSWLGKGGDRSMPTLIVGTQVLEQSLDYDADWMASDIAPIDLLLQRMGRLWRHLIDNPPDRRPVPAPRFTMLCAEGDSEAPPVLENAPEPIYDRYILLRSWLEIRKHGSIVHLPDHIENLVENGYRDGDPPGLSAAWAKALDESRQNRDLQREADAKAAEGLLVCEPVRARHVLQAGSKQLDDDEDPATHETVRAATRLGDPSITVICRGTDADGKTLAPSFSRAPTPEETRELMRWSVSIQSRRLFRFLLATEVPEKWRTNAHLRHCRALDFDRGQCPIGKYTLRLSRDEGLAIEASD